VKDSLSKKDDGLSGDKGVVIVSFDPGKFKIATGNGNRNFYCLAVWIVDKYILIIIPDNH
jgi:hypothetical protein